MVADADVDLVVSPHAADGDLTTLGRVLDRVAQQVGHDLRDSVRVALGDRTLRVEAGHDEMTRARRPGPVDGVVEQAVDINCLPVKRQPAGLDAVHVEHVGDHPVESLRFLVDVCGVAL